MKKRTISCIFAFLVCVTLNSVAQENVYFCSENFSVSGKPTNQIALKPKEENGKKLLNVQPAKGAMKMFAFGAFAQNDEASKLLGGTIYTAKSSFNYAEGKSISAADRLVQVEDKVFVLYTPDKSNPTVKMAFAKDEASAKEWAGEKGLGKIKELEKGAADKAKAEEAANYEKNYGNSTMPKPGKLHTSENAEKAKKAIEDRILRDGGTIQKIVIVSDEWNIVRNKNTGIVVARTFNALIAETHPKRAEGWCMKFLCTIRQEHDGTDFSGGWKCVGVGQTLSYGPIMIHVRNLDK